MSSYSRQQLESWLKTIDVKAGMVLDVGGSQLPIKGRTKSWDVGEYKILDLEQPHEFKQKPDYEVNMNADIYNYFSSLKYKMTELVNVYDAVFLLEVLEYLINPLQALKNCNEFLKPGGVLYLSSHFIYPVHNPNDQDYLRYTRAGIIKILEMAGFKVEEIKPRLEKNEGFFLHYSADEGMRPSKEYDGHYEVGHLIKAIKL